MRGLRNIPLLVILMGISALAMFVPALHGAVMEDWRASRIFFYAGLLFFFLAAILSIATYTTTPRNPLRGHIMALPLTFLALPVMLAVPFNEAVPDTSFLNSYFEMVSSLTTTGATLFDDPVRLPLSVHLWRALVGWMGGFFVWVTAIAILAPMNLGGFEVVSARSLVPGAREVEASVRNTAPRERLLRYSARLFPIYAGLTGLLWLLMFLAGEDPFVSICHAMSTLATSGISPVGGLAEDGAGVASEIALFPFLIFAISRQTFTWEERGDGWGRLLGDSELRMGLFIVLSVTVLLFLRHWLGAYDVNEEGNVTAALGALWGSAFTLASFLSTTGFISMDWTQASDWSGLQTPGLILLGVALIGGGVATTAGGVKLLRVFALFKHSQRELEKLVHPDSVGGAGAYARHIRRQGAYMAWVFFVMFALSVAGVSALLSLTGVEFEDNLVLTVSALSTTGPLAGVAGADPISFAALGSAGKLILAAAMVLGRLEVLAIVALLNPSFWRS
ncbi:MAG: potassium transporter TrkG [Paracoccaceae bacterium]